MNKRINEIERELAEKRWYAQWMELVTPKVFGKCPCCGKDASTKMGVSANPEFYAECTDEDCGFHLSHGNDESLMILWGKVTSKMATMTATEKEEFRHFVELANKSEIAE